MSGYQSFAKVYDTLMSQQVDYNVMADRICSLVQRYGGRRSLMLDLACGGGALSLALMQRKSDVIGVDSSAEQLTLARQRLSQAGFYPLLLCQDMTELDLYGTIESAVCTMDSLNHLKGWEEFCLTLSRVALFLEPGGLFLFDMNTVYKHSQVLAEQNFVYDCDSFYCVWQNEYCQEHHRVDINLDLFFLEKGRYRREHEYFFETDYSSEQILEAVKKAGLSLLAVYDGYEEKMVTDTTQRILYVAQKK